MLIYGAGGHAKVVIDCLLARQESIAGIFDDNPEVRQLLGVEVMNFYSAIYRPDEHLIIAIGNNGLRKIISEKVEHGFGSAFHPGSEISEHAFPGDGTVVFHLAVVQSGCRIGRHVIVNTAAVVDHDCFLADYVHVGPNSTLCGGVQIGEGSLVGAGAVVLPGVSIGRWCTVGAGSVVTRPVPDFAVVAGNPARAINP